MNDENGRLPSGWFQATGEDLFEFLRGISYKKTDVLTAPSDDSVTILRAGNLQDGRIVFDDLVHVPESYVRDEQRIRKGDLIIAMSSGSATVVGKVAVVDKDMPRVSFGAFCGLLRPRTQEYSHWLSEFFQTKDYRDLISSLAAGININNLRREYLYDLSIPVPPISEMQRLEKKIEALQERSQRAREALSEVGTLLEQFRQSVLAAAFRGDLTTDWRTAHPNVEPASELLCRIRAERRHRWEQTALAKYEAKGQKPPKNWQDKYEEPEPVDDSYLPALPEGWCWAGLEELKDLSPNSMTDGPFGSKLKTSHYSSSGIRVVRLGNIGVGHFNASNEAFIPEVHYEELRKHEIFAGDLVIAALAEPVARCCKIPPSIDKAIVKADCIRFRPHPSVLSEIVMHWLNSGTGRRLAEIASHGIGRLRINMENLRPLPVALPPVDEQIEIVARITGQLAGIARIEEQVSSYNEDLDQLDQSILAKAFRGELVRQDPNDESAAALLARIREQKTQQTEAAKHKQKTSMPQRGNKMSEESSRLTPQQLTLAEMLLTKD